MTSNTAPAHLHATRVALYPALFPNKVLDQVQIDFPSDLVFDDTNGTLKVYVHNEAILVGVNVVM